MNYGHGWIHFDKIKQAYREKQKGRERESIAMTAERIINNSSYFNPMNLLHSSKQAGLTFQHDNDEESLTKSFFFFFLFHQLKHTLTADTGNDCQVKIFSSNTHTLCCLNPKHTRLFSLSAHWQLMINSLLMVNVAIHATWRLNQVWI